MTWRALSISPEYEVDDDGMEEGEAAAAGRGQRMGPPVGQTHKRMAPGEQFRFMGPGQSFKTKVRAVQVGSITHGAQGVSLVPRYTRGSLSKPVLKAPMVSALGTGTRISQTASNVCFQFQRAPLHHGVQVVRAGEMQRRGRVPLRSRRGRASGSTKRQGSAG